MRCLFLFRFRHFVALISIFHSSVAFQEGVKFATPNYPRPYTGSLSQRTSLSVNGTQGVAVVFEQFLASTNDCVIACPTTDDSCSSLCGDAMDHGLKPKILRVEGPAIVTMVSVNENDGFPHSGISAKLIPYDLQKLTFFNCNDEVDLSSGETFYLVSQNYPSTPTTSFSECSIKFKTSGTHQGIRFAVYDFYLNALQRDSFRISGNDGNVVNITGFATEDEPVVYYFRDEAHVTFSINLQTHSFLQKRFYILVQSYEVKEVSSNCGNIGKYDIAINQTINFGTRLFGTDVYENNLVCAYNFTRTPGGDSIFALAIQYESEKCCDTMIINGLSIYEEIYQGYQYSNLFFTYSQEISFLFQSDAVVGGPGLNASLQHIDCTCPPALTLSANGVLTSPGYSTAISYCPNMLCQTKIAFDQENVDLQMDFTDVSLRSYSLTNDTDSLSLFDAYEHRLVKMMPSYAGFETFWATVSPVLVEFSSHDLLVFPLDRIGQGFSVNLNLVPKNIKSETVSFDEGNFFKDISHLDLSSGQTFEFIVNGRKNHQIFVYFFTKTTNQVFVDFFDGATTESQKIDNKALYSNIFENGPALKLSTTSDKAVLRIRGNPTFLESGTDFQAMITDLSTDNNCGPLVYSLRTEKSMKDIGLQGQNCYTVLHFSDGSYNPSAFMNVDITKNVSMQVFLGLTTNSDRLIAQNSQDALPQDLFTNYLVLKHATTDTISMSYSWDISSGIVARTMQPDEKVLIMSEDYGKPSSGSVVQQFSVEMEGESNVQTGLQIGFLSSSGNGAGTLTWSYYNAEIREESFTNGNKSLTFRSCGNKLLIDYTSPGGGPDNGLYVEITRADLRCSQNVSHPSIFVLVLLCLNLL